MVRKTHSHLSISCLVSLSVATCHQVAARVQDGFALLSLQRRGCHASTIQLTKPASRRRLLGSFVLWCAPAAEGSTERSIRRRSAANQIFSVRRCRPSPARLAFSWRTGCSGRGRTTTTALSPPRRRHNQTRPLESVRSAFRESRCPFHARVLSIVPSFLMTRV